MDLLDDTKMYLRFLRGLPGFFRHTITLDEARNILKKRIQEREDNVLRLIERGIYGFSRSPYLPLLRQAGCELGDIKKMVRSDGLEKTLHALRDSGVFFTFEEFKGRKGVVRSGKIIHIKESDFDNPYLKNFYYAKTSGSTGAGTRVPIDLDHLAAQTPNVMLSYKTYGPLDIPRAFWLGVLPSPAGINHILRHARFGCLPEIWYSPVTSKDLRPSLKQTLATKGIIAIGHIVGRHIPQPQPLPLDKAVVLARWAADKLKIHGICLIRTGVSMCLRICVAAQEQGLDLSGTIFVTGGEPPTPGKIQKIKSTGARLIPTYFFSETGVVGMGCGNPLDENDIHFFKDLNSIIQYPRQISGSSIKVDAFYFTSLLPSAPKILLNVEIDDYGIIEQRSCGCDLEEYGFVDHIRQIRSFSKLTTEGMTLVGSEMFNILDNILPSRFGGSSLDYQLVEEENEEGFTQINLIINPKIIIENENEVIGVVLSALGKGTVSADYSRATWKQAKTLRIKRENPVWTDRGKLMPLHLGKRQTK